MESLVKKVVHLILPVTDKYFLWSAESNSSLFNFSGGKIVRKETEKKKPKENFWDNIWNIVHLNKQKKESLVNLQPPLTKLRARIQASVKDFLEAKDHLLEVAKDIADVIQNKVLLIFQYKKTLKMIRWINEVILVTKR